MLIFIRCPFHPRVTAVALKSPRSFCQKCRWLVTPKHAYILGPFKSEWTDYAAVQASVETYLETSSHQTRQGTLGQSYQFAEPLWTDPGLKSGISVCELISTKKSAGGNELSNILQKSSHARKKTSSHHER